MRRMPQDGDIEAQTSYNWPTRVFPSF